MNAARPQGQRNQGQRTTRSNAARPAGGGRPGRTARQAPEAAPAVSETVFVDRVGHRGDGIAETASGPLYVPFALPGEELVVERRGERGRIVEIVVPSSERVEPACVHFGRCGGCALQHWQGDAYRAWKREQLVAALAGHGIEAPVEAVVASRPGERRRVSLTAERIGGVMVVGFHERASHGLFDLQECPVADPAIVAALPALRRLAEPLAGRRDPLRLTVTATRAGLDVAATDARPLDERARDRLVSQVLSLGFARFSLEGEVLVAPQPPTIDVDGVAVVPSPGGFLQASARAEAAMAALVVEGVGDARRVLDLFAGIGTFALRLARTASVHAVDGDAPAVAALGDARRFATDRRPITAEVRDLFRRPFQGKEFARYDAVVLDPPFAGARAQSEALALVAVPRVVMVSCNPATLARDLAVLVSGGYRAEKVVPVDQFLWSPHIEAVAFLRRG
ncbi:class I SAM-dependent RNA methyltransferase [Pseudoxanthobacter soli]|uniref:class I SAM-dependent RNA methyltransferase n=1 Tax=Pseudoxanthobacter soli TaxID=433840 RepID=UPI000A023799|nr:class I SAM-dependent RNA methyltransferase [Pseudoxanthobacter soli]